MMTQAGTLRESLVPGGWGGQTIVFCGLLGWAFGPRNFMKNLLWQAEPPASSGFQVVLRPCWDGPSVREIS